MHTRARIYTADEHLIPPRLIDPNVIRTIERLKSQSYRAYVVGGAVRDLLCGTAPKDFDLVTSATPQQICALFRKSRIIGRRFRLVHLYFESRKIIELATFRATSVGNQYGQIEEDALRRDFSANALYYDPVQQWIVDYVGGVQDIQQHRLNPVIPLSRIFQEDAVRMVRAIKYSVIANLRIGSALKRAIKTHAALLRECPRSRLTEETLKVLLSTKAYDIFQSLNHYRLLSILQPKGAQLLRDHATRTSFLSAVKKMDNAVGNKRELGEALYHYLALAVQGEEVHTKSEAFRAAKKFLLPATPPNAVIDLAIKRLWGSNR